MDVTAITRRKFVNTAIRSAGSATTLALFGGLGAAGSSIPAATPFSVPAGVGQGRSVVVVGAGISGLVGALELGRAGFSCTIIEAADRIGGRVLTLRGHDSFAEGSSVQSARWPRAGHLYFNAGASRISHSHVTILEYCRQLGVRIRPIVSDNRAAMAHDPELGAGHPVAIGRIAADLRGHIASIASTVARSQGFVELTAEADPEKLADLLDLFGGLNGNGNYSGSSRAGYQVMPGLGNPGHAEPPIALTDLLLSRTWQEAATLPELQPYSSPMFEPEGGMDELARAFLPHLPTVQLNTRCLKVERRSDGRVVVTVRKSGANQAETLEADCILTALPLPALAGIEHDFGDHWRRLASTAQYVPAVRAGLYCGSRFWEQQGIFGGQSRTALDVGEIGYPSAGLLEPDGILIGAHVRGGGAGVRLSALGPMDRHISILRQVEQVHPGCRDDVESAVSVAWRNMPHAGGGWMDWNSYSGRDEVARFQEHEWPNFFAGDHLSALPGWQEGAAVSARSAVGAIIDHITRS